MIYDDLALLFKPKYAICVCDGDYHRHLHRSLHWTHMLHRKSINMKTIVKNCTTQNRKFEDKEVLYNIRSNH